MHTSQITTVDIQRFDWQKPTNTISDVTSIGKGNRKFKIHCRKMNFRCESIDHYQLYSIVWICFFEHSC